MVDDAVDPASPSGRPRLGGGGLGLSVARRWAPPGPRSRARPAPLGSVAEAAMRFSAGLGRAPQIRRQLAGPASVRPAGGLDLVRPPLWWLPNEHRASPIWGDRKSAPARIPDRLLRRAAGKVPGRGRQPGSAGASMTGTPVSVRREPDVQFSRPMK